MPITMTEATQFKSSTDIAILWSGEPAAAFFTNYLKPALFTIYTKRNLEQPLLKPYSSSSRNTLTLFKPISILSGPPHAI